MNLQHEARRQVAYAVLFDKVALPSYFTGGDLQGVIESVQEVLEFKKLPDFSDKDKKNLLGIYPGFFDDLPEKEAIKSAWFQLTNDTFDDLIEMLNERLPGLIDREEAERLSAEAEKIDFDKKLTPAEREILEEEQEAASSAGNELEAAFIRREITAGFSLAMIRQQRKIMDHMNSIIRPLVTEWAGPARSSLSGRP